MTHQSAKPGARARSCFADGLVILALGTLAPSHCPMPKHLPNPVIYVLLALVIAGFAGVPWPPVLALGTAGLQWQMLPKYLRRFPNVGNGVEPRPFPL